MQEGFVKLGAEMVNLRNVESFGVEIADQGANKCYVRFTAGDDMRLSEQQLGALQEAVASDGVLNGVMTLTDISGDRIVVNLSKVEVFEPDQRVLYVAGRPFMLSEEAVADLSSVLDYTAQAMA